MYEKYCYAKLLLHHPFSRRAELLEDNSLLRISENEPGKYATWAEAYQATCLDRNHEHEPDSLPTSAIIEDDPESDSESITQDEEKKMNYRAEWMQEACRAPNDAV
jgi:hypothetical protein